MKLPKDKWLHLIISAILTMILSINLSWIDHGIYVAHGYMETGEVGTPNPNWETFNNETEWKARLLELGVEIQEEVEDEL